ncbi:MAG: BREX-4 system phosphatase PglZ [Christensenellaceae bacterium]|nr:BREX-4 system phosphatase PglZ [Christensenellaceae bacterium]
MFDENAKIDQICQIFGDSSKKFPLIVNVNESTHYMLLRDKLHSQTLKYICVSQYFEYKELPKLDSLINDISVAERNTILLGFSQYYCFNGGKLEINHLIKTISNGYARVLLLTFGISEILKECIKKDPRIKERADILLVPGKTEEISKITLTPFKQFARYESIKSFFEEVIELSGCGEGIVYSELSTETFSASIYQIAEEKSAFEILLKKVNISSSLQEDMGTPEQWKQLLEKVTNDENDVRLNVDLTTIANNLENFSNKSDFEKWLLFIKMKSSKLTGYLAYIIESIDNYIKITDRIYYGILNLDVNNRALFDKYYIERKELIAKINDNHKIVAFINLADSKGKDKVLYLTDSTPEEREEIIKCFANSNNDFTCDSIKSISKQVYGLLSDYLADYQFLAAPTSYTEYFNDYRYLKIRNKLTDSFLNKVEQNAIERDYYKSIMPRQSLVSNIDFEDSQVYWVDALGVEFCAFLNERCRANGLSIDIQIAYANLPTITKFNNEFYNENRGDKKIGDLDELKHKGKKDYDYSKTEIPVYITEELNILNTLITQTIQREFQQKKKVIILSDHGASRLIRLKGKINKLEKVNADGNDSETCGGRFCPWNDEIPVKYKTVCDMNNNGYCVIANYDRFQGGRYVGAELHGGATLEEVLVPVIVITKGVTNYEYRLDNDTLHVNIGITDNLIISVTHPISNPRIRIEDLYISGGYVGGKRTKCSFPMHIKKAGKYTCTLLDGNTEIITAIPFSIQGAAAEIKDDFI